MARYDNKTILKTPQSVPYIKGKFYPNIPLSENDIYVLTVVGDRLDLLANQYYGDSTLYWIISRANNHLPSNSIYPPEGTQIRIPTSTGNILSSYNIFPYHQYHKFYLLKLFFDIIYQILQHVHWNIQIL